MDFIITIVVLLALVLCSGFFSGSETAMMSLNRYKLNHLVKQKSKAAKRSLSLISRPDKLLGMILIGNTFANIIASAILTSYAEKHFSHFGVVFATVSLTLFILLFAEIMPKILAALFPQKLAFAASPILYFLLIIAYPLVWLLNLMASIIFRSFGVNIKNKNTTDPLSSEEIHSVVHDSTSKLSAQKKNMLLGVLELGSIKVEEVMIPHHKIEYINLNQNAEQIISQLTNTKHTTLIACYENIENIAGIIATKKALKFISQDKKPSYEDILKLLSDPYYIPNNLSIKTQLINFQKKGLRFALVVNEYGEIQGIITVEDIIEEIVGEFSDTYSIDTHIQTTAHNHHVTKGETTIREINRHLHLDLPTDGAKTIAGFIIDKLKEIPLGACCLKIENYIIEVQAIKNNMIQYVKITKHCHKETS